MSGAILIGFNYRDVSCGDYLPGITIDLYLMYRYCVEVLEIPTSHIKIVTDIKKQVETFLYAIVDGIVDTDIFNFISDVIVPYDNDNHHIQYLPQIMNALDFFSSKNVAIDNLLLYYSGHGENGHLNLPEKRSISLTSFRDMIFKNIPYNVNILWILDCCHTSGAGFTYKYNLKEDYLELNNNDFYVKHNCILITSCNISAKAVTTHNGSEFTQEFINIVKSDYRKLSGIYNSKLLSKIREIYTTKSNHYLLPSWIFGTNIGTCIILNNYIELLTL